jgi:hypothetical protein
MSRKSRAPWGATLRMVGGSVLGILGFGTLSVGFEQLAARTMAMGGLEILLGTFLALGVMAPLRRPDQGPSRRADRPASGPETEGAPARHAG